MNREERFMMMAIELSQKSVRENLGGPFGCIVVKGDEVIGRGFNRVTSTNDPTAHAEIVAIRDATANIKNFQLDGCELYTTCEPCPMCLGAIYWARVSKIFYANSRKDAAQIGFDDEMIYSEFGVDLEERRIPLQVVGRDEALKVFDEWKNKEDKRPY